MTKCIEPNEFRPRNIRPSDQLPFPASYQTHRKYKVYSRFYRTRQRIVRFLICSRLLGFVSSIYAVLTVKVHNTKFSMTITKEHQSSTFNLRLYSLRNVILSFLKFMVALRRIQMTSNYRFPMLRICRENASILVRVVLTKFHHSFLKAVLISLPLLLLI